MDKNESTPQLKVGRTLMTHNWPVLMWETVVSTSEGEPFAVAVQGTEEASRRLAEHIVRSVAGGEPEQPSISCEVFQHDWIPGFAAFHSDGVRDEGAKKAVVLNLGSLLCAVESGDLDNRDLPYMIAESLMHETVHALEEWAGVEFSEDRVEELLAKYREKYGRATIWEYTGQEPSESTASNEPWVGELIEWLENESEEKMKTSLARRASATGRDATETELKAAKQLAEKMAGRKLDLVSTSPEANRKYCDMQVSIGQKCETLARKLARWSDLLRTKFALPAPPQGKEQK